MDVLRCPPVSAAVVTQLVTHRGLELSIVSPGRSYHLPWADLAMRDVVRRLVERRAEQLVMAASAGDPTDGPFPSRPGLLPVLAPNLGTFRPSISRPSGCQAQLRCARAPGCLRLRQGVSGCRRCRHSQMAGTCGFSS